MGPDNDSPGEPHRSSHGFADALANLKQDGAAILVVGEVPETVSRIAQTRLFGEDTTPPRRRIVISTTASSTPPMSGTSTSDANQWVHLSYAIEQQRTATSAISPESSTQPVIDREYESLTDLGSAIVDAITDFEEQSDGLAPAQLRLGFDSIEPLVDTNEEALFRFLHLLIARVKSVQGMAHVPLLWPVDSRVVQTFTPLFDALIELRVVDGIPHQRWVFPSSGLTSSWLSL